MWETPFKIQEGLSGRRGDRAWADERAIIGRAQTWCRRCPLAHPGQGLPMDGEPPICQGGAISSAFPRRFMGKPLLERGRVKFVMHGGRPCLIDKTCGL
jgi:hypothetical protein